MMRVGIGYDMHRLTKRRKLILGGVNIQHDKGLSGHSDADVLLHAVCDALLGAAAQKDIGEHFPSFDPVCKNISSIKLLQKVNQILKRLKYSIKNIDCVIVAEEPSLASYKTKMAKKMAHILNLSSEQVNVKAKTAEGLGPIGKKTAISAYAVALLEKRR